MLSLRDKIISCALAAFEELIPTDFVPNPATRYKPGGSTGNLAFNAFTYDIDNDELRIYVDKRIAPYMPYTNEPWISPYWNGKKNPNQGWWQRFVEEFVKRFTSKLRGTIENDNDYTDS